MEQQYFSLKQVSIYLGLSSKTLYNWAWAGKIPAHKCGRVWRFDKNEIEDFVRSNCVNQNNLSK